MSTNWPVWWRFEFKLSNRLLDQLGDIGLSDVDVLTMLELADAYRESLVQGRYVVEAEHLGDEWDITIEPDNVLSIVTVVEIAAVDWKAAAA
ncbi:MAG: hypothetical protein AAGB29_01900 [Planctomycetota bacterium]